MKSKIHQTGMINVTEVFLVYLIWVGVTVYALYRHSGGSSALIGLLLMIGIPILIIMTRFAYIKAEFFFSARKYRVEIANFLADYPDGKLMQIEIERWEIYSKNTGKKLAKIFLKSTGEITKVNLSRN